MWYFSRSAGICSSHALIPSSRLLFHFRSREQGGGVGGGVDETENHFTQ